jgi:hypothetical protein
MINACSYLFVRLILKSSGTFNVAAASAVGTDVIRAVLDATVTTLVVYNTPIQGNAPRLPDGRTLKRQLRQTNLGNNFRRRAHIRVHGFKIVAKRFPDETAARNVVLVATHIVKHLQDIAGKATSAVISVSGGHDGSKKDGKVQGNDLHGRWLVVDRGGGCQSREIVRL